MSIQQTMSIIQPLVQDVIWPLVIILVPWLYNKLKANLPANKQAVLDSIVKHAVQKVEQTLANATPEEKRNAAKLAVYDIAQFLGYKIDENALNVVLESFVWETKQLKLETTSNKTPASTGGSN